MKNELYTLSQDSNKQWAAELNIKIVAYKTASSVYDMLVLYSAH